MANESNIKKRISLSWLASAAPNNDIRLLSSINDLSKECWLNSQGENQSVFLLCIDWSTVDKEDYLLAMERSPIRDIEIKHVLKKSLTKSIDRLTYMKGLDVSYHIEGYNAYKAEEL